MVDAKNETELLKRYEGWIKRAALQHKRRWKEMPLEDFIQEASIGFLEAARRFRPDGGAHLTTYSALWMRKRMKEYTAEMFSAAVIPMRIFDGKENTEERPVPATELEQEFHTRTDQLNPEEELEASQQLEALLEPVPARERFVIHRVVQEGHTFVEVASEMGIGAERVRQLYNRGCKRLRAGRMGKAA